MAPFYTKAYLAAQVRTGDRVALVVALYEAALMWVRQAMDAIDEDDVEKRSKAISRALGIVSALCEALDHDRQAEGPAAKLFALYTFHIQQLLEANRRNDVEPLMTVKSSLAILLDGWNQIVGGPAANDIRKADAEAGLNAQRPGGPSGGASFRMTA